MAAKVARPLLGVRRDDLRKYLRARKQKWREDATNRDTTKTRARVRKRLLPLLVKQFNPAVVKHLAELAERAREQAAFVEQLVEQLFKQHVKTSGGTASIRVADVLNPFEMTEPEAGAVLRARLIQEIVARTKQRDGQVSARHLEAIAQLARSGEPGKRVQIPGGLDVVKEKDALVFQPRPVQH